MTLELLTIPDIPLVRPGDDLAGVISAACEAAHVGLRPGDVVVVTGKVVSKAEGRLVDLRSVRPSARAARLAAITGKDPRLVEVVLRESVEVIRARPGNLLVRHRLGYVSAVAGVDRSNVDGDDEVALLLPADPDLSAAALRTALARRLGVDVGVVVTDSHGRPFRIGNTGVAIGVAGILAMRSLEGRPDLFGRPLTGASIVPIADLIASAAMLVCGEGAEGIPVVIARGLVDLVGAGNAAELIRPPARDLFAVPDRDYS